MPRLRVGPVKEDRRFIERHPGTDKGHFGLHRNVEDLARGGTRTAMSRDRVPLALSAALDRLAGWLGGHGRPRSPVAL